MKDGLPAGARREFLKSALGLCAAVSPFPSLVSRSWEVPMGERRQLHWGTHPVARIPGGYQVAVADVNHDGRLDILALSHGERIVEWYENPSWTPRPIASQTQGNISLAPLCAEGHRLQGLALATDFALENSTSGGNIWWTLAPSAAGGWSLYRVGQITSTHRIRWAELNGDGRPELVVAPLLGYGAKPPDYNVGAPLTWLETPERLAESHGPADASGQSHWSAHLIDDSLTVIHGIDIVDWDGDGREEILTASLEGVCLYDAAGSGSQLRWTKTHLATGYQMEPSPRRGASEEGVGKVGGQRFLATIEPWHGEQVVVYLQRKSGGLWQRQVIDDSFRDGHALVCADLDQDGNDEIVAGFRGAETSLYVYYAADASGNRWTRQLLDNAMAASAVVAADVNGDGRLDLVAVGSSTANLKWYENLG